MGIDGTLRRRRIVAIAVLAGIAVIAIWVSVVVQSAHFQKSLPTTPERVSVGVFPEIIQAPLYIADDNGLFLANGIDVRIRPYETGKAAAEAMRRGEIDLAAMSEYAFSVQALDDPAISIIANDDKSQRFYVITREDRGISGVADLAGKRIGIARRTAAEFYLGRLLVLHGISFGNVTIVDLKPHDTVNAFRDGQIDAFIAERSAVDELGRMQNGTVMYWQAQGSQPSYSLIVGREDWINSHPDLVERLLRSLDTAIEFAANHPEESRRIIEERLNLTDSYTSAAWPDHRFGLSLDQSLVLAMEDEARWMIANNLTNATAVPDFRTAISTEGLGKVKPDAVNIIG